jgi:hypothetical protein
MVKLLVLFVFHQYTDRVKHFLTHSIFYDVNVDFLIICNDKNINIDDEIIHYNVSVFYRDNIGYDFGGWSDGLLTNNLYQNYTHFIFVNSSALGPYLRPDYKGKWTDIYVENLKDNIKLFGSTINANHQHKTKDEDPKVSGAHVQSYIFSMDIITLYYLIHRGIFTMTDYVSWWGTAVIREIYMSRCLIEHGWNIGSLLKVYQGVDFTFRDKTAHDYEISFTDDFMYDEYENIIWNKYDLVFIKGNRKGLVK